jgi:ribosomal protein L16 Arg81 hydroxylase
MNYILIIIILLIANFIYDKYESSKYVIHRGLNIKAFEKYTIDYFNKIYGETYIYITYSPPSAVDTDTKFKKVKFKKYIDKYMSKKYWYFKTEDYYNFLKDIGLYKNVCKEFSKIFPHPLALQNDTSFWLGGKGSTTGYHTDREDVSYLYVLSGRKTVKIINPKFTKFMYPKNKYYYGASWSKINFKNVDYEKFPLFKKVIVEEIILNAGDCIVIPRNWWHAVENMEDTLAISYKIFRPYYCFVLFPLSELKHLSQTNLYFSKAK